MSRSRSTRALFAFTAAVLVTTLALSACTKKKKDNTLPSDAPAGATLLSESATAMRDVQTVHFALTATGQLSGLSLHSAEGDLLKSGDAKGSAIVNQGALVSLEFVIVGATIYLKGPTGGYQSLPLALASTIYDPSAILDPERGVVKLLSSATNAQTVAKDQINGADAYKVTFTPDITALGALVPGATAGSTAAVWVDAANKRTVKGEFALPASGSAAGATVVITFSDFDKPVTVSAP